MYMKCTHVLDAHVHGYTYLCVSTYMSVCVDFNELLCMPIVRQSQHTPAYLHICVLQYVRTYIRMCKFYACQISVLVHWAYLRALFITFQLQNT